MAKELKTLQREAAKKDDALANARREVESTQRALDDANVVGADLALRLQRETSEKEEALDSMRRCADEEKAKHETTVQHYKQQLDESEARLQA